VYDAIIMRFLRDYCREVVAGMLLRVLHWLGYDDKGH